MAQMYTCMTRVREQSYLSQHAVERAEDAIPAHVAAFPFDDGDDLSDAEIDWLRLVANGETNVTFSDVAGCQNSWFWLEGSLHQPQYLTYVIQCTSNR